MGFFDAIATFFIEVFNQLLVAPDPFYAALVLLVNGGWVVVLFVMFVNAKKAWLDWRENIYGSKRKFVLLAIDVPRDNEQVPKAIENIFTHLHGVLPSHNTLYQTWWEGKNIDPISFELVSIEGYVQFLVRCCEWHRDIVESAFYSQYPDAEITEVEDYVNGQNGEFKNLRFPSNEYEMRGTEMVLAKKDAYPIRVHIDFEHSMTQEFKDPMASLLEAMNKIGPGEQMWIQIVATPEYDDEWQPRAHAEAMKIAGKKIDASSNVVDKLVGGLISSLDAFGNAVFPFYNQGEDSPQLEREMPSLMLHLTPAEQKKIEGIQLKADKHAYWCKLRFMYIAKKDAYSRPRGESPIMGSFKQFSALNLNSLKRHKWTKTSGIYYLFVKERMARRQNNLFTAYQDRARSEGSSGMILNTEELATLYHFPTIMVKAPLVSRTQSKRASAPVSLPVQGAPRTLRESLDSQSAQPAQSKEPPPSTGEHAAAGAPSNLPFV